MRRKLNDMPHYTDDYYRKERTIWGKKEKGLFYNYSDRLQQWNYEKHKAATETADKTGATRHTAEWYQNYLTVYEGQEVELKHILAGHDLSSGYPYQVFGYKFKAGGEV